MEIIFLVLEYLPTVFSFLALFVHIVVAHRLKCEKNTLDCIRSCLPGALDSSVSDRLKVLEDGYSSLISLLRGISNGSC